MPPLPAIRASSSGRSCVTMVRACVPSAGPGTPPRAPRPAAARARQLRHEAGVPRNLRRLAAGEVAQRRALDERALGVARSRQRRQRRSAHRLATRSKSGTVDVVGERGVEPRHQRADERRGPRAPRCRTGRAGVGGGQQVQRRQQVSATDTCRRREDRVLVVEVDVRGHLGEREVEADEFGHVGALVLAETEAASDLARPGPPRARGGPDRRPTCRRRVRAPPPGVRAAVRDGGKRPLERPVAVEEP